MKTLEIEVPPDAYDLRIVNDLATQGLVYKTPNPNPKSWESDCGWKGHFISFGSAGQSPIAGIADYFERQEAKVIIYPRQFPKNSIGYKMFFEQQH